jgi:putative chitinase
MKITSADILNLSTQAIPSIVREIVEHQLFISDGGIDTPLRLCHFMAQIAHESAHFRTTREFASGKAYENRRDLGNIYSGDGERYRGRGLIQTTGRANYQKARDDIRKIVSDAPDFEYTPEVLEEFPWALLSAVSYFRRHNINRFADRDDIRGVTCAVNGGLNGFEDRKRYLTKAKGIWLTVKPEIKTNPVLSLGSNNTFVTDLQNLLIGAGYRLRADGHYGKYTLEAVVDFQSCHSLAPDGVVGEETWAALRASSDPLTPFSKADLTDSYIQVVPDKCDRIIWRNRYMHLPIVPENAKDGPVSDATSLSSRE